MVRSVHSTGESFGHFGGHLGERSSGGSTAGAPFSFDDARLDIPQPVHVSLGGFTHPGEVIVARRWLAEFGRPLSGVSMFRLVLLRSGSAPKPDDLADDRICVAAPRVSPDRIGETRAVYSINPSPQSSANGPSSRSSGVSPAGNMPPTPADIRSLREVRRNYVTTSDPGLGRLASALAAYESQVNSSMAAGLREMWRSGVVVTSPGRAANAANGRTGPRAFRVVRPGEIFLLPEPESWVQSAAAALDRAVVSGARVNGAGQASPERIFGELQAGRVASAREQLRQLCGIRIDGLTPVDRIDSLIGGEGGDAPVSGGDLVQLLIHELGFPPAVASLWPIVHVMGRKSELELTGAAPPGAAVPGVGARREICCEHLSEDTISEFTFDAGLISRISGLHARKSDAWDAVLPYLKLVVPHVGKTAFGGGRDSDAAEFDLEIASLRVRLAHTTPVMFGLEVAVGATDRPLTADHARLSRVLGAGSWRQYVAAARKEFGSVGVLKSVLADAARQWSASEHAPDIERAIYYLDQAEFGRVDHALAVEHRVLRSRFDPGALTESPHRWLALRDDFERWRLEYRKAYLEDHSARQERDSQLRSRIQRTTKRVLQLDQFERIDVLRNRPPADGRAGEVVDIVGQWSRVVRLFHVCELDGLDIRLTDTPACPECHTRLGQSAGHGDVVKLITLIDRAFEARRDDLAGIVSELVLNSETSDRLQKLFRLKSAGDLSDLANVLDEKVISFLNELFGSTSGKLDDWTLPPS